jgi:DNA-binding response OmpR family regulator
MTELTAQNGSLLKSVILVIDEDRDFLADCVMPLIQAGYEVLTAIDSLEAQYLCELYPKPIHLVMLDIPLEPHTCINDLSPQQYGKKMVAWLRVKRPSSHILITSLTPAWKVSRQRLGATLWQFPLLQWPCSASEMLNKIQALLLTGPESPPTPPAIALSQCA